MTEKDENQNTETKETDMNAIIEGIEKKVMERLDGGFSAIESKLKKPEPEPSFLDEDDGGDDEFFGKKDLPKLIEQIASHVEKRTDAKLQFQSKKQQRDMEAMNEFPELNQGATFNKRFFEEVGREVSARVQRGRKADDPDLIYDAAASVNARGIREGWHTPKRFADLSASRAAAADDSFDVRGKGSVGSEPTEAQVKLGATVGLPKERLTELLKKTGNLR